MSMEANAPCMGEVERRGQRQDMQQCNSMGGAPEGLTWNAETPYNRGALIPSVSVLSKSFEGKCLNATHTASLYKKGQQLSCTHILNTHIATCHMHTHTHIATCHMHTHTHIATCHMHTHTHIATYHMHTHTHIATCHMHTHTHIATCHMHTHTHIATYHMHTHTHIATCHMHTHTHIATCHMHTHGRAHAHTWEGTCTHMGGHMHTACLRWFLLDKQNTSKRLHVQLNVQLIKNSVPLVTESSW